LDTVSEDCELNDENTHRKKQKRAMSQINPCSEVKLLTLQVPDFCKDIDDDLERAEEQLPAPKFVMRFDGALYRNHTSHFEENKENIPVSPKTPLCLPDYLLSSATHQ
jgi:hypothetical protein